MKAGWRNLFPIALFFLVSCTKLAFAWGKSWSEIWSGDTQGVRGEFWQPDLVSMTRQPVQGDKAVRGPGRVCESRRARGGGRFEGRQRRETGIAKVVKHTGNNYWKQRVRDHQDKEDEKRDHLRIKYRCMHMHRWSETGES